MCAFRIDFLQFMIVRATKATYCCSDNYGQYHPWPEKHLSFPVAKHGLIIYCTKLKSIRLICKWSLYAGDYRSWFLMMLKLKVRRMSLHFPQYSSNLIDCYLKSNLTSFSFIFFWMIWRLASALWLYLPSGIKCLLCFIFLWLVSL